MDIKFLISVLNRPWFFEPAAAVQWAELANSVLRHGSMPAVDKRRFYGSPVADFGPVYRVNEQGNFDNAGAVQVFRMNAPIAKYDYCGDPGSQTWQQHIAAANADPTVKSIVLWIDSPGGQVDGTEQLANAVKNSAKPVVAYTDGLMCSAAYWIGSSASEIIVDMSNNGWNATIGSIGTMAMWEDNSAKREKEGTKLVTVFADASSDKWGDYFSIMEGDYTRLKQELNGLNDTFLAAVSANRAGKINVKKENVLTGKTYSASEALANGLADRGGTFLDAVKRSVQLYKKSQKSIKMSNTNSGLAFGLVLAAAGATAFEVVDGGFMLTEEHLNSIEAKLDQDAVTESTTAKALKTLQAQEQAFSANATVVEHLETANATIADLNTKLADANAKIAALGQLPGGTFKETTAEGDPAPDSELKTVKQTSFEERAEELLNM